jgi:hypothetical protein
MTAAPEHSVGQLADLDSYTDRRAAGLAAPRASPPRRPDFDEQLQEAESRTPAGSTCPASSAATKGSLERQIGGAYEEDPMNATAGDARPGRYIDHADALDWLRRRRIRGRHGGHLRPALCGRHAGPRPGGRRGRVGIRSHPDRLPERSRRGRPGRHPQCGHRRLRGQEAPSIREARGRVRAHPWPRLPSRRPGPGSVRRLGQLP